MKLRKRKNKTSMKDLGPKDVAEQYVQKFNIEREILGDMQEQFAQEFPQAALALESIKVQEDIVEKSIADAKAKVAAAGETVGEFKCSRAFSAAGYDEKMLFEILQGLKNRGELLDQLFEAGVIKGVKVDKPNGNAFAAANPKLAEPLSTAWMDKYELTPRVSVPKM